MNNKIEDTSKQDPSEPAKKPGFFDAVKSAMWAMAGIQNSKNRDRDFKHGKASNFIVAGIIFVVLFVGVLITIVNIVLP